MLKNMSMGRGSRIRDGVGYRAVLPVVVFLSLLLGFSCAGCGSGSSGNLEAPKQAGDSKTQLNALDLGIEVPCTARLEGTILAVQEEADYTHVKLNVSGFTLLDGEMKGKQSLEPGTEAVLQARNTAGELRQGDRIAAGVRVMKSGNGYIFMAEDVKTVSQASYRRFCSC